MSDDDPRADLHERIWAGHEQDAEFPQQRPLLAHYTSIATIERIIANEELWFSNPLLMNDLDEIQFGIREGMKIVLDSEEIRAACKSDKGREYFRQSIELELHRFIRDHLHDTYVFCCSEHAPDDNDGILSMWRGYGSSGNGAAIVVNTANITPSEGSPLVIAKVHYGSVDERRDALRRIAANCCAAIEETGLPVEKLHLATSALFERIKLFALYTKHRGFSEEKEWRVVYLRDRDDEEVCKSMFHYAAGSRGLEPKLKLKIAPLRAEDDQSFSLKTIVDRIILGPSVGSPLALQTFYRMLDVLEKPEFKERVRTSSIPFRAI